MIVTCHSCQTRFRVADEKIGPKGARVRCSRCQAVFAVRPLRPPEPVAPPEQAVAAPSVDDSRRDDPFARAAAIRPTGTAPAPTVPDLALEETQRVPSVVRPDPEPSVASRDPGLLDFGDVDLSGPDPFSDARREGAPAPAGQQPSPAAHLDDPLAGLSFGELGDVAEPATTVGSLPPPVDAPPLAAVAKPEPLPEARPPPVTPNPDDAEQDAAADAEHSRKRLRSVGFNALSLVVLVVLAIALFQVWRGRQGASAPSERGPVAAVEVSSAPYVTASGKTVVVVRGQVRASEPLRRVAVRADLLDGGRAVASGVATAGAQATMEEIYGVTDAAAADALASTVASRAPPRVGAGETLPFTAVVADPPANLRDVEVRVSLQPER